MEKLKDTTRGLLLWGITLSILLPIGIVMIPIGFVFKIYAVGIIGIIITIISFYGTPLVWVNHGIHKYYISMYGEITNNKIRSMQALSNIHNKKPQIIENDIKKCIQRGYYPHITLLNGKIIDKKEMTDKEFAILEAHQNGTLKLVTCPNCHAQVGMINGIAECNYCGSKITEEMIEKN